MRRSSININECCTLICPHTGGGGQVISPEQVITADKEESFMFCLEQCDFKDQERMHSNVTFSSK